MAAFPRVSGHPDYSSSGTTNRFIPEIWSGKLQVKFYDAVVTAAITNTDYQGEIANQGDKVIIRTIPTITIKSYKAGTSLVYDRPESPPIELDIDQGYYWALTVDDVMAHQSDLGLMNIWSTDASEQLKLTMDTNMLTYMTSNVHASNTGATAGALSSSFNIGVSGTPIGLTKANILDYIIDCGTVLDEQNIPETGRWFVIPPWAAGMIKKSDLKDASLSGDGTSIMRNGRLGMIDRFTLYNSNRLVSATDGAVTAYSILFGHKLATTFASQITKTEALRAETTFGDLVRGLNVFGRKAVKPEGMGKLYCYKA
jgi:hypothetical protein